MKKESDAVRAKIEDQLRDLGNILQTFRDEVRSSSKLKVLFVSTINTNIVASSGVHFRQRQACRTSRCGQSAQRYCSDY